MIVSVVTVWILGFGVCRVVSCALALPLALSLLCVDFLERLSCPLGFNELLVISTK